MRQRERHLLLCGCLLLAAGVAPAEPFTYAEAESESAAVPDRYLGPLPLAVDPDPSWSTWRRRMDWIPNGPTHLQHRLCRDGAIERDRFVAAFRRAVADGRLGAANDPFDLAFPGCFAARDRDSVCDWVRARVDAEPPGGVRAFFYRRLLGCAAPEDAPRFERSDAPASLVVAFHRTYCPPRPSPRLDAIVRERAAASDVRGLARAASVYGARDAPEVVSTLLELLEEAVDPERRQVLGLALRHQSDPRALEPYRRAWRVDCERRRANASLAKRSADRWLSARLGYVLEAPSSCETEWLFPQPPPPWPPARSHTTFTPLPHETRLRSTLRRVGLEHGLLRFYPAEAESIGSHAPLLRRLSDLVRPDLDGLVFEEIWPALDAFRFERGAEPGWVSVEGDGFRVRVPGEGGEPDTTALAEIRRDLADALARPHFVDAYLDGARHRFRIRGLGRFFDMEALVGVVNTLLRERSSERRLLVLEPFDLVDVVAGTRSALRSAIRAGVIRPGDPFAASRALPEFPSESLRADSAADP